MEREEPSKMRYALFENAEDFGISDFGIRTIIDAYSEEDTDKAMLVLLDAASNIPLRAMFTMGRNNEEKLWYRNDLISKFNNPQFDPHFHGYYRKMTDEFERVYENSPLADPYVLSLNSPRRRWFDHINGMEMEF